MAPKRNTRRRFLAASTGSLAIGLAGCTNSPDSEQTTAQTDTTTDNTNTATQTAIKETTSGSTNSDIQVAEEFTEHFTSQDFTAASDLFKPYFKTSFSTRPITRLDSFENSVQALERYWTFFTSEHGPYTGTTDVSKRDSGRIQLSLHFEQTTQVLFLEIDSGQIDGLGTPYESNSTKSTPEYVDYDDFEEFDIFLQSDGPRLEGTITVKNQADKQVPGVVLLHGSFSTSKNYRFGPNLFFRDLAHYFASQGIASIRYRKRPDKANMNPADQTIDNMVVKDAVEALEQMKANEGYDNDQLYVVGFHKGGRLAPRVASQFSGNVKGIALLDSTPLSLGREFELRLENTRNADYYLDAEREDLLDQYSDMVAVLDNDLKDEETYAGISGAYWKSYLDYDPLETAASLSSEFFVAQAGRGTKPAKENLQGWRDNLIGSVETHMYDEHNRFMQPGHGDTSLIRQTLAIGQPIDEETLTDLSNWIN